MIKKILIEFDRMGKLPINFYKFGVSITILALSGIYMLCESEVERGGVGVELYYAPMLDYIFATFTIFWAGMFIIDLTEKEITAGKKHRR
jgi:hypothetical protein